MKRPREFSEDSSSSEEEDDDDVEMAMAIILKDEVRRPRLGSQFGPLYMKIIFS
jgi:hypothetical protein